MFFSLFALALLRHGCLCCPLCGKQDLCNLLGCRWFLRSNATAQVQRRPWMMATGRMTSDLLVAALCSRKRTPYLHSLVPTVSLWMCVAPCLLKRPLDPLCPLPSPRVIGCRSLASSRSAERLSPLLWSGLRKVDVHKISPPVLSSSWQFSVREFHALFFFCVALQLHTRSCFSLDCP